MNDDAQTSGLTDEILEDCLQALHRMEAQGRHATLDDVMAFARIPPEVVEAALRELQTRGLIDAWGDAIIRLSDEGQHQAASVVRRHRLSERLLTDVLGLPWDRVHDEAMRLEHSITPEAESRLQSLLHDPETCPHGAPILGLDEAPARPDLQGLDTVPAGTQVRVQRVMEEEASLLRYLSSLGLFPRADLVVEELAPFGGPLLVRVGEARYAIGREVAAKILVSRATDTGTPHRHRHRRRGR